MSEPCSKGDKIDRIESDVNLINERLNRHSDKIDKISDNNLVLETILRRLEEDGKEQKQTNAMMNNTLLSVQSAMTEITYNIKELNTGLAETNKRVDSANEKLYKVDEKTKVDVWELIKSKAIPFLFGGGCIYGLAEFFKQLFK
jgi:chromosome segregation ATPase